MTPSPPPSGRCTSSRTTSGSSSCDERRLRRRRCRPRPPPRPSRRGSRAPRPGRARGRPRSRRGSRAGPRQRQLHFRPLAGAGDDRRRPAGTRHPRFDRLRDPAPVRGDGRGVEADAAVANVDGAWSASTSAYTATSSTPACFAGVRHRLARREHELGGSASSSGRSPGGRELDADPVRVLDVGGRVRERSRQRRAVGTPLPYSQLRSSRSCRRASVANTLRRRSLRAARERGSATPSRGCGTAIAERSSSLIRSRRSADSCHTHGPSTSDQRARERTGRDEGAGGADVVEHDDGAADRERDSGHEERRAAWAKRRAAAREENDARPRGDRRRG